MSDWKSEWYEAFSSQYNKKYWYNIYNYTTWYDPNKFSSEKDFDNVVFYSSSYKYFFNKGEKIHCDKCRDIITINTKGIYVICNSCEHHTVAKKNKLSNTSQELQVNSSDRIKEIENERKKRKLYNDDLISCRENTKKVIDKLNIENKKLKLKILELQKELNDEKRKNKDIKKSKLFDTVNSMTLLNTHSTTRQDGKPSKNDK